VKSGPTIPGAAWSGVIRGNVAQPAFQAGQNLVHSLERGALFEILKPMERRGRNAQSPRELGVGRTALFFSQKRGELLFKSARHTGILPNALFRMRNIWR
jgi:hypothetical protein